MGLLFDRRVIALLRVGLGVLFLLAGWPKFQDPAAFSASIDNYHLVPEMVGRISALVLPPLELLIGIGLVFGVLDAGASLLALALLVIFTGAVGTALARGLDISCGCFDTEGGPNVGFGKLAENAAFIAAAFVVWRGDRSWGSLSGRRNSTPE